jgi:hypothetical protein
VKTIDHYVYSVSAYDPGGAAENFQINHKPGDTLPGLFLCPYKPAHGARIAGGHLYHDQLENVIQARPGAVAGYNYQLLHRSDVGTVLYYVLRGSQRLSEPF